MKRITIHYEGLDDDLALLYAREALYKSKERKGIMVKGEVTIIFSDRSKHLALTIIKKHE